MPRVAPENRKRKIGSGSVRCICKKCGVEFFRAPALIAKGGGKFCTKFCMMNAKEYKCLWCGGPFIASDGRGKKKFCTPKCNYDSRRLSDEERKKRRWQEYLTRVYRITPDRYFEMVKEQGSRCLGCEEVIEKLFVDHCHATGKVRGLLCVSCNTALGHVRDSIPTLGRLREYLIRSAL